NSEFRPDYTFSEKGGGWLKLHSVPATWSDARILCHAEGVPLSKLPIYWASGEPNNFENSESCLAMVTSNNGTMRDVKCTKYNFNEKTGKCYKFHRHGLTWPRAHMTCMAEGAHLAVINSEEEFGVLRELFAKNPDNVIFSSNTIYAALGFSDPNDGGSWITIHGQTLKEAGFERWQSGEPNNASQPVGELCGVMYRGNGNFYDAPCYWPLAFICVSSYNFRFDYSYNKKAEGWLKLHEVPTTWNDAQFLCKAEASPLTNQLRDAIIEHVLQSQCSLQTIFTGVHSIYSKGVYSSVEGVPLSRMSIQWAPGQPDNFENSESCLVMLPGNNGTVGDVKCTDVFPFVCYKKRTQSLNTTLTLVLEAAINSTDGP
ncbi:Lectin 1 putative immunolectin, partial [Operophtera brumata]